MYPLSLLANTIAAHLRVGSQVKAFCEVLKRRLEDRASGFEKAYLRLLVDEIRVEGKVALLRGSHAAVARLVEENDLGTAFSTVPRFGFDWRARHDSNVRPTDSKSGALSN